MALLWATAIGAVAGAVEVLPDFYFRGGPEVGKFGVDASRDQHLKQEVERNPNKHAS